MRSRRSFRQRAPSSKALANRMTGTSPMAALNESIWAKELGWDELFDAKQAAVAGLQGRWRRWVSPNDSNGNMVFGLGELAPGEVADWHEHPEAEVFFVLAGRGEAS